MTPPRIIRKEVEPPEIARVKRILELAKEEHHPVFPCLHLIAYTGMRRGKALGLRHQDLSLEADSISIVQTIGRSRYKGLIVQPTKANAGRRSVDLDDGTVAILRAHIGQQLLSRLELGNAYEDNAWCSLGRWERHLTR